MAKTIKSPIDGYNGTAQFSEVTLDFKDGVANVERISKPLETYLKRRGYDVKGSNTPVKKDEPADSKSDDKKDEGKDDKGGDVL